MTDRWGLEKAANEELELEGVGQELLAETELVRIWGISLEPGESQGFHLHRHPYIVISLGGDSNEVETIFGDTRPTDEPPGNVVIRDEAGPIHRLTNKSDVRYACRLIELKTEEWHFD